MAIGVSSRQRYDTVDEESPVATVDSEEVIDDGPQDLSVTEQHQWAEIKNLEEFDAFDVVPLSQVDRVNVKFISTRFVDTEEKSRLVTRLLRRRNHERSLRVWNDAADAEICRLRCIEERSCQTFSRLFESVSSCHRRWVDLRRSTEDLGGRQA